MNTTEKKQQLAAATFQSGYNCAQSVLSSFAADSSIERDMLLRLASPFGSGIAKTTGDLRSRYRGHYGHRIEIRERGKRNRRGESPRLRTLAPAYRGIYKRTWLHYLPYLDERIGYEYAGGNGEDKRARSVSPTVPELRKIGSKTDGRDSGEQLNPIKSGAITVSSAVKLHTFVSLIRY
jgi:Putative redox-active protein (C_GCAxxG_C_C).